MASEPNPYWHQTAKIGDEYGGDHIAFIYHKTNDYIIFRPAEDDTRIVNYYADDKLRDNLDKITAELNKLKIALPSQHPLRKNFLSAVAQVYSLAFQNKIQEAKDSVNGILEELHKEEASQKPVPPQPIAKDNTSGADSEKKNTGRYLLVAMIGFVFAAGVTIAYLKWYRVVPGLSQLIFYMILLLFSVGIAALIFGLTGSAGKLEGTYKGVKYKFAGPVAGAIVAVLGFFFLKDGTIRPERTLIVQVMHKEQPINTGAVKLFIPNLNLAPISITDGQAIFSNIPEDKLHQPIDISVRCPGYLDVLMKDTIVGEETTIKVGVVAAGKIKVNGRVISANEGPIENAKIKVKNSLDSAESLSNGKYYLTVNGVTSGEPIILLVSADGYKTKSIDVEPNSDVNVKDITLDKAPGNVKTPPITGKTDGINRVLKVGDKYEGGIIFYLEKDGRHGLVAAEKDQGIDVAWWIRTSTITRNSYSLSDGYANSENIVADQGNSGAYAALLCRNYQAGGFKDWFLPSIDQLEMLYNKKGLVKNLKSARYWSSTANGENAWYFDMSNKVRNVDFPSTRYRVRAIREF
jgi:hypothetical protein